MLPEEYERRRRLPQHLRERPYEDPPFSFTLRAAAERDLPAVAAIYRHYVLNSTVTLDDQPKPLVQWRQSFRSAEQLGLPFIVAVSGQGTVIGFAYVQPWKLRAAYRHTVEDHIYLGPATTGKGLGTALLGALIERAEAAGCREMLAVIVDQGADASIRLHERFGFVETGRVGRVGRKFGRWLGVVSMRKVLRPKRTRPRLFGRA